eukprot:gene19787-biopygen11159
MVGDFYQLDPVRGPSFWCEDAKARLGIDLLLNEFGGHNFIELTEQCRVLDVEFQREVLQPMRVTDDGPSAAGMKMLRSRIITKQHVARLTAARTHLIAYCNSQKDDHVRSRARVFARTSGQRLYWSVAEDRLAGEGTRRAWAARRGALLEQKKNWLALDDKKAGRRLGCLPLCIGMPIVLNDHVNRERGLVAGLQGRIIDIWFKGSPPQETDAFGEVVCSRVPVGVLVQFNGFPAPIPIGRSAKTFHLGAAGTATSVRRNQIPVLPDFGCTAHLCQGTTMTSALVDLDIPPGGDTTASYVAISRVRTRNDLFILRPFDVDQLRRGGSKAGVDILLRRLRGELGRFDEGSKECMGCHRLKPRSAFVSPDSLCTRQWNARKSINRRCLQCLTLERRERDARQRSEHSGLHKRVCHGVLCAGTRQPRTAFHHRQLLPSVSKPVCNQCRAHARSYLCCSTCGCEKHASEFSAQQLHHDRQAAVCTSCAASNPTNKKRQDTGDLRHP